MLALENKKQGNCIRYIINEKKNLFFYVEEFYEYIG